MSKFKDMSPEEQQRLLAGIARKVGGLLRFAGFDGLVLALPEIALAVREPRPMVARVLVPMRKAGLVERSRRGGTSFYALTDAGVEWYRQGKPWKAARNAYRSLAAAVDLVEEAVQ